MQVFSEEDAVQSLRDDKQRKVAFLNAHELPAVTLGGSGFFQSASK